MLVTVCSFFGIYRTLLYRQSSFVPIINYCLVPSSFSSNCYLSKIHQLKYTDDLDACFSNPISTSVGTVSISAPSLSNKGSSCQSQLHFLATLRAYLVVASVWQLHRFIVLIFQIEYSISYHVKLLATGYLLSLSLSFFFPQQIKEIFNLLISFWKDNCDHISSSPSLSLNRYNCIFHVGIFFFSVC